MTDKKFLDALEVVLGEFGRADLALRLEDFRVCGDEARANELQNAFALLDAWLKERRSEMAEPTLGELVRAAHRQLRDNPEYQALIDAGDLIAAAQFVRNQARETGGRLSHAWLDLISTELAAIVGKCAPTSEEEKQS